VGTLYGETVNIDSPFFAKLTDDQAILTQAILMRLNTARGTYWADTEYGLALSNYINDGLTLDKLATIPREVQSELEKDDRVAGAFVRADLANGPMGVSVTMTIQITPVEGKKFDFTIAASAVTVELITVGS
jgi:hypothetical protein